LGDADADKARQERLAAALRSNLARRKAKVRASDEAGRAREGVGAEAQVPAAKANAPAPDEGTPGDLQS